MTRFSHLGLECVLTTNAIRSTERSFTDATVRTLRAKEYELYLGLVHELTT